LLRNHETGQEAVVQGQGTETEIIGGEVAAGAEKGMGVIETGTIVARAGAEAEAEVEAEVRVQVLTAKIIVEQEMMISAGAGARVGAKAEAEAGVEATHTIVLHLLGAVLALAKAHHQGGAPLLKSTPMERICLHHAVFLHHQSMQAPVAQAVRARSKAC